MPRCRHALGFGRVNLLKKIKVGGKWTFCPAVVEPGRRLNDLVRVNGQIETHPRALTTSTGANKENAGDNRCGIAL
jgi:hypothetical protein